MKRIIVLAFLFCYIICAMNAQVETHYYGKDEKPNLRKTVSKTTPVKYMPAFDIEKVKKENAEKDTISGLYHFGKGFDVSYTLEDGAWEEIDGGRLWTISFESSGALSLNFVFDDFFLPEGAELYVTNADESIVFGPVTSDALSENGHFLTDIISGSQATISLFEPFENMGQSTLTIKRVVHGYRDQIFNHSMSGTRTLSDSPDAACYPDYDEVSDGVGLLITSYGEALGTCSLVMTTDFSFKPYILTSFFCIDDNLDGTISSQEKTTAENSMVKFRSRYETCHGITSVTSYTYNQTYFRSAYRNGGMALLELRQSLKDNPNLTWLGWNRDIYQTGGAVLFHSNDQKLRYALTYIIVPPPSPSYVDSLGIYSYALTLYIGKVFGPAVGSPYFDASQRISAITSAYRYYADPNLQFLNCVYVNPLIESWYGGLTDSTGLAHWLDPESKNWVAMPSSRVMKIVGVNQIISSRSYYVQNLPSDMTVTWTLSDPYYNQNCLQQNCPESNQCTITRSSLQEMTYATLTATLKLNGTTICTFQKIVSTSDGFDGTYYNGVTIKEINLPAPLEVLPGTLVTITSPNLIGASVTQISGNLTPTSMAFNSAHNELYLGMPSSPTGAIVLGVTCSDESYYILPVTNTLSYNLLSVTPSANHLEISLTTTSPSEDIDSQSTARKSDSIITGEWCIEVYNVQTGEKMTNMKVSNPTLTLDTSSWKCGVYVVRATIDKDVFCEKVYIK